MIPMTGCVGTSWLEVEAIFIEIRYGSYTARREFL